MNELQKVFNYGDASVRTVVKDEEVWFVAKDVSEAIGIDISQTRRLSDKQKSLHKVMTQGGAQSMVVINENGLKHLVTRSRSPKAIDFAKFWGWEVLFALVREQETLDIISNAFSHIEQKRQFPTKNYRIDLYFPKYKLAIECDERNHSRYNQTREKVRERSIEKNLGCKFIRFDPDAPNFNVGSVINQIIMEVYECERLQGI